MVLEFFAILKPETLLKLLPNAAGDVVTGRVKNGLQWSTMVSSQQQPTSMMFHYPINIQTIMIGYDRDKYSDIPIMLNQWLSMSLSDYSGYLIFNGQQLRTIMMVANSGDNERK